MTIDRALAIIALLLVIWYLPAVAEKRRTMSQKRLDTINAPGYIERQRELRDRQVITGLLFVAATLLLDVERFISSFPKIDKYPLLFSVFGQLICAIAALGMFANALDHHQQTDLTALEKQRVRIKKALGQRRRIVP